MPTSTNSTKHGKGRAQRLDALAFYLGAHGNDPTPVKDEIEARFVQETLREKEEPLRKLHSLESKLLQVRKERPEAESVWQRVRKELGDTAPPYFHALFMALIGLFALLVDALILAPSMDMIGVADPAGQYVAAAGFAMLFTAWFELSGLYYLRARGLVQRSAAMVAGTMGILSLIVWGLLRGHQLRFAAGIAGNPLSEFLGAHPVLSATFFIFITLATPMVGASALLTAWRDFSAARMWRRERARFDRLRNAELELPRQILAEVEQLEQFDRRKEAECREWKEVFNQYYDRGQKNNARREALWFVIGKTFVGVIVGVIVAMCIPAIGMFAEPLIPSVLGLGLFLFFNHRRFHPSHEGFLARENTKFAVNPEAGSPVGSSAPAIHLLPKGDHE